MVVCRRAKFTQLQASTSANPETISAAMTQLNPQRNTTVRSTNPERVRERRMSLSVACATGIAGGGASTILATCTAEEVCAGITLSTWLWIDSGSGLGTSTAGSGTGGADSSAMASTAGSNSCCSGSGKGAGAGAAISWAETASTISGRLSSTALGATALSRKDSLGDLRVRTTG